LEVQGNLIKKLLSINGEGNLPVRQIVAARHSDLRSKEFLISEKQGEQDQTQHMQDTFQGDSSVVHFVTMEE